MSYIVASAPAYMSGSTIGGELMHTSLTINHNFKSHIFSLFTLPISHQLAQLVKQEISYKTANFAY